MDSLEEELLWFEEEFQALFENKNNNFSSNDKKTASRILNKLNRKFKCAPDKKTKVCLRGTLTKLKKKYPNLIRD
ncbi:MAG: hypothetical protein R6U96_14035 [Promethearchaeia archaeon]